MRLTYVFIAATMLLVHLSASGQSQEIPSVPLKALTGKHFDTVQFNERENPVILSFWATWCGPCLKELDAINDVYADWQEETGVELYAISTDDSRGIKRVKPLVNGKGWEFEVLLDENQDFQRKMNVVAMPTVLVVYKGKIIYQHTSYVPGSENKLYEKILEYSK
ncbi:TlpA family protein disulfide reductase [Sinomicrobium pectinilyticum]|uniref:TlpA family protein disulfide reductase n=1 Tax=Sinomicrobium pectinilyticum TaxID=1084421 RepID=A0A3N0DQP5_SINP1|nr:TlpA disulfide reductase family protein [Sinomicrobium pectinilyticum]RNL77952.1 TlpA family protein disulfide reductase [Sinomicrobium pectinilyticum]